MKTFFRVLIFCLVVNGAAFAADAKTAIFAGGCFWCMQPPFDALKGVVGTEVGYAGGHIERPSYEDVSAGNTGHYEVIRVMYDPAIVSYAQLLDVFWRSIDPVDAGGQFCDRGQQYTSAIFAADKAERMQAEESKMLLEADDERFGGKPIATKILDAKAFYPAEGYHQSYYKKNPIRYKFYRGRCGRDQRLHAVWGEQSTGHK